MWLCNQTRSIIAAAALSCMACGESTPSQPRNGSEAGVLSTELCSVGYHVLGSIGDEQISLAFEMEGASAMYDAAFGILGSETLRDRVPTPGPHFPPLVIEGGLHHGSQGPLNSTQYLTLTAAVVDRNSPVNASGAPDGPDAGWAGDLPPWNTEISGRARPGWFQLLMPAGPDGKRVVIGTCHTDLGDSRVLIRHEPNAHRHQWQARWTFTLDRVRRVVVADARPGEVVFPQRHIERWSRALCAAPVMPGSLVGCGQTLRAIDDYQPIEEMDAGVSDPEPDLGP